MKPARPRTSSIIRKLRGLVLGAIVLQTALLSGILVVGGVVWQARDNAFQAFHDKVAGRKDALQNQMKNQWTNFAPYLAALRQELGQQGNDTQGFLTHALGHLIPMLRTTQSTGAFVILDPSGTGRDVPALYLRDYDPTMNSDSDDDLYMVYGPPDLAKAARIPMDQTWRPVYTAEATNPNFLTKPLELASQSTGVANLGYWSTPFQLSPGDVSVITYTVPLQDELGRVRGILGVEITLNYLTKALPAQEIQTQDSLGYLIAYRSDPKAPLVPIIQGGALQRRLIPGDQPLRLVPEEGSTGIARLEGHLGKETLYADAERIGLYQFRTPFEKEQWFLVGIARGPALLAAQDRISQTLVVSLLLAIIIGTLAGTLIAYQVTKPIATLASHVRMAAQQPGLHLAPTGLAELDELSRTVETVNRRMLESASRLTKIVDMLELPMGAFEVDLGLDRVFVTDKFWGLLGTPPAEGPLRQAPFLSWMAGRLSRPEPDDASVFRLEDPLRWLRYKVSRNDESMVGVLIDVTEEIQQKRLIQSERDRDPLTGLWNRKGFQWEFDQWRASGEPGTAALVMFDLDNLKTVNDTYGHRWGDQYIVAAVQSLARAAEDRQGILGRRSGDEFVLLLHGFEDQQQVRHRLDAVFGWLASSPLTFPDGVSAPVSVSAGLKWIDGGFTYDELLHFADEALYVAKRQAKGTLVEATN